MLYDNNEWDSIVNWFIPGLFWGLIFSISAAALWFELDSKTLQWFLNGFWPEALGMIATVFIIDRLIRRRDKFQAREQLKAELVNRVRSNVRDAAVQAINEIRNNGWLEGEAGLLKGKHLSEFDLQGAWFTDANLEKCNFDFVNLKEGKLNGARLHGSHMVGANLANAQLINADLSEVNLVGTKLMDASLWSADLRGAILMGANLKGADLESAKFSPSTVLPDAEFTGLFSQSGKAIYTKYWTEDVDMSKYTDRNHLEF